MTKGILGRKVGMTQIFTKDGILVPVTVVEATPNVVMQVKTVESDGYEAIQLGYQDKREVLSNKPETTEFLAQWVPSLTVYLKASVCQVTWE